jgi:hypothetical protein
MKTSPFIPLLLLALAAAGAARAADSFTLTVTNDLAIARPAETIVIPFGEVKSRLPAVRFDQIVVKDAAGQIIPAQITSFHHVHKGPPHYDDLIFQHDFAAGEKSASFTVALSDQPVPPFPQKANVRYIPERYDDVAWENDKIGHRIYGPGLELPTATKDQATCSGIDVWSKRVPYMIIDHWYHKGHDGLHTDTGEGLDMYDVNTYRGCGGTGIWDGKELHVSRNWRTEMVYANGPVRAVFDLGYEPWDGGSNGALDNGFMVAEKKHFVIDAGHNLDEIESTFDFKGSRNHNDGEITVAIGLTKHSPKVKFTPAQDVSGPCPWMSIWEEYPDPADGHLGTAIILAPGTHFAGILETAHDRLILVKAKSGEPVRYYAGAGWNKSGDFSSNADWVAYLAACAQRLASPVKVMLPPL